LSRLADGCRAQRSYEVADAARDADAARPRNRSRTVAVAAVKCARGTTMLIYGAVATSRRAGVSW